MDQAELFSYLIKVLEIQGLRYGIAGSHASMSYGEWRLTNDIDVLVELTPVSLPAFSKAFPFPEFLISEEGARVAAIRGGMFNIIHPESGVKIDVIVPTTDFDRQELVRAVRRPAYVGSDAAFLTPEDVIIKKMAAYEEGGSEKHLRDIAGMLKVLGARVDRQYVSQWASKLGISQIWDAILARLGQS